MNDKGGIMKACRGWVSTLNTVADINNSHCVPRIPVAPYVAFNALFSNQRIVSAKIRP